MPRIPTALSRSPISRYQSLILPVHLLIRGLSALFRVVLCLVLSASSSLDMGYRCAWQQRGHESFVTICRSA
ncbi:hypothetical protein K435DRAFT_493035 [Dendrothele bispora CBS 962.96]|uniref:Uncharacterized protein n=1 Tax=Dendrothele bispora (strain CBS 962.96) TaxID=1314807 RepID=A0A4S8MAP2_DENBC|nr:hypothetical protein K435DRAFT_493035 [Dendrothele bispora CBS 962.96]